MHSSFLPFAVLAEPLLSVAVKLFSACCACICVCLLVCVFVCTCTHVSCVPVCANKDNSVFCLGMHPHFVFGMPECQIIPCERAGGPLCLLQSLERKHESFCL